MRMDIFTLYAFSTAAWLSLQSIALLVVPKLIIALLANENHVVTDVEIFFSRTVAFALLTLACINLLLTEAIPLSAKVETGDEPSPYATATRSLTTVFHSLSTVYCWLCWTYPDAGTSGHMLGAVGSGGLAVLGAWCVLFGGSQGHVSRRTGADKRTTGFPFKNTSAYNKKLDHKMG